MRNAFIENYVMNIFVALMIAYFYDSVMKSRNRLLTYIASVLIIGIIGPVASIPLPAGLSQTLSMGTVLLFAIIFFKEGIKKKLLAFCICMVIVNLTVIPAYYASSLLGISNPTAVSLAYIAMFIVFCGAVSFMVSRVWRNIDFIVSRAGFWSFFLLPLTQFALTTLVIFFISKNPARGDAMVGMIGSDRAALLLFMFILALSFVADGVFIQSFARLKTSIGERERLKALEAQSQLIYDYIKIMEGDASELRSYRHDALNLMGTIKTALERGDVQDACKLTAQMTEHIGGLADKRYCDCALVNCILAFEESRIRADGIECDISAELPEAMGTNELDLCRLVTNMLDNAREACLRIEGEHTRSIYSNMKIIDGYLYITVRNSRPSGELRFVTGKEKTADHGRGMSIIRDIVSRHNGALSITDEDDAVEILATVEWKADTCDNI